MKHKDKLKHFLLAFIFAVLIYWLTQNKILTIFAVLFLGLIKELADQQRGKNTIKESITDILADVIGITLGILFSHYLLL